MKNRRLKFASLYLLAIGNLFFALGLAIGADAYIQIQNSSQSGILTGAHWWNELRLQFIMFSSAEFSFLSACLLFSLSAITHEINYLLQFRAGSDLMQTN